VSVIATGEGCNSKGMFSSGVMGRKAGLEGMGLKSLVRGNRGGMPCVLQPDTSILGFGSVQVYPGIEKE
jgi:hypothetical protein